MSNLPVEFSISVVGEVTGESYKGVFKAKPFLSHRDTMTQDQMRRDLLGTKPESAGTSAISSALVFSKIWIHLTGAVPNFWKDASNGLDLLDEAPVVAVYDNIVRIEKEAVQALKKEGEEAAADLKKA